MEFSVSWKTGILVYFRNPFRDSLLLMFSWNRNKSSDLQSKSIDRFLYQEIIRQYSISCQCSHSIPPEIRTPGGFMMVSGVTERDQCQQLVNNLRHSYLWKNKVQSNQSRCKSYNSCKAFPPEFFQQT